MLTNPLRVRFTTSKRLLTVKGKQYDTVARPADGIIYVSASLTEPCARAALDGVYSALGLPQRSVDSPQALKRVPMVGQVE